MRQVGLEGESFANAVEEHERLIENMGKFHKLHEMGISSKYSAMWFPKIVFALSNEKDELAKQHDRLTGDRLIFGPLLSRLPTDKTAAVALSVILKNIMGGIFNELPSFHSQVLAPGSIYLNDMIKDMAVELHMEMLF